MMWGKFFFFIIVFFLFSLDCLHEDEQQVANAVWIEGWLCETEQ